MTRGRRRCGFETAGGRSPRDLALSSAADGPFGRERLVLGAPIGGPHLLVVEEPAGTIDG